MRFGVEKEFLWMMAGIVWVIAGINILRIGIMTWLLHSSNWLLEIGEATIVFLLFFIFIFKRIYHKNTLRIEKKKEDKHCPFAFFDAKGWIIMAFMIAMGVTIRRFKLLPDSFISVFYTGLSIALILTGVLFIRYWWNRRKAILR